jgi:hypothetical protein
MTFLKRRRWRRRRRRRRRRSLSWVDLSGRLQIH